MQSKINLIVDIDLLGLGHVHDKARTGVFRVTEELFTRLLDDNSLNVYVSSCQYLYDAITYLEDTELSKKCSFIHSEKLVKRIKILVKVGRNLNRIEIIGKVYRKFVYKFLLKKDLKFKHTLPSQPIFFSPYLSLPKFLKNDSSIKKVLLIHDLIAYSLPHLFDNSNRMDVSKSIESADEFTTFVCVSKSTKKDLKKFFPALATNVKVIPLAASKELFYQVKSKAKIDATLRKYGIPNKPYLLSISTLEPRKNIESTIKAFNKLLKEHHEINASLVLVGTLGWQYESIFNEITNSGNLKNHVVVTGYVEDEDLADIYTGAKAFIYPSLYEGFGLPPLEAMQCGVPVVVANNSSLPEVVGEAGIFIDAQDKLTIKDAMESLLTDRMMCQEYSLKSLERAKEFSWEKSVDSYVNIFKKMNKS